MHGIPFGNPTSCMKRFCILLCTTVFSTVGWWLGEDRGMMTAFLLSTLGGAVGIFAGIKLYDDVLH